MQYCNIAKCYLTVSQSFWQRLNENNNFSLFLTVLLCCLIRKIYQKNIFFQSGKHDWVTIQYWLIQIEDFMKRTEIGKLYKENIFLPILYS